MKLDRFSGRLFMIVALVTTYCVMGLILITFAKDISSETKLAIFAAFGPIVQNMAKDYFNRNDREHGGK